MSYEAFCSKVNDFCRLSGLTANIFNEDGRHTARLSDGGLITANTMTPSVTYRDPNRNHIQQYRAA